MVAVVIPARNAQATLPRALAAIEAQTLAPDQVIVSEDPDGHGPGHARNAGAAQAPDADVLAFTDADCFPDPGWLAAGVAALEHADLVQGRVLPDGPVGRHDRTVSVERPSPLFESANLFVRRELFDALGGFGDGIADPRKHLAEDVYFGWAARRAGARIAFAPDALVHHAVFPRSAREAMGEQLRARHFPEIVRIVPELRDAFLHHRIFLSARSRDFDLALLGILAARRHPAFAALALPYLRRGPQLADAVTAAALLAGSVRHRMLVI